MNLLPFDYEEAKKDPERVRFATGKKPEWVEFVRGVFVIQIDGVANAYNCEEQKAYFRLTPKPHETVKVWFVRDNNSPWHTKTSYPSTAWDDIRGPIEVTVPEE